MTFTCTGGVLGLAYALGGQALATLDSLVEQEEAKLKPQPETVIQHKKITQEHEETTVAAGASGTRSDHSGSSGVLEDSIAAIEATMKLQSQAIEDAKVLLDARAGNLNSDSKQQK